IAIVAAVVWFSPWLVVKNIDVEGVVHGDKDAIVEASGISENQKLIRLDTDASARSVAGQPWVDSVTVSRSWPQGVTISVRE
ncbi:FtsQ-type POTRA domain-containing protein, partial [Escherichia coli]|nr:FtsQ-type POTRA domain-containing protein [Escherichia coli]